MEPGAALRRARSFSRSLIVASRDIQRRRRRLKTLTRARALCSPLCARSRSELARKRLTQTNYLSQLDKFARERQLSAGSCQTCLNVVGLFFGPPPPQGACLRRRRRRLALRFLQTNNGTARDTHDDDDDDLAVAAALAAQSLIMIDK